MNSFDFNRAEMALLRKLNNHHKIQRFLDEQLAYNTERDGETCRSPRRVMRDQVAHCAEGAYFAAAALRVHGESPLIIDLIAVRDSDHLLAAFRQHGRWGAIGKSNYSGLRFREPVYQTVRELVMSYFAHFYNPAGELTLRGYSMPVNLARLDSHSWMTMEEDLFFIGDFLNSLPHRDVLQSHLSKRRMKLDQRLYDAGLVGAVS